MAIPPQQARERKRDAREEGEKTSAMYTAVHNSGGREKWRFLACGAKLGFESRCDDGRGGGVAIAWVSSGECRHTHAQQ